MSDAAIWHDLECGGYDADLPLWRTLAAAAGGPVLDIGAGTGRVALDLARHGHDVVALDIDAGLLAALRARAGGARVEVIRADARDFALGRTFPLVLIPMQTVQLLPNARERARLLAGARDHTEIGGLLAIAIADALDGFDADHSEPPLPDVREIDGVVYASRPVRVVDEGDGVTIERLREVVGLDGSRSESADVVRLARVTPDDLEREGVSAGFDVLGRRVVPPTDEYVGSVVVMLRG